jgi:ADP-ribose pyrophosphatase YjhB (NUDIX family)
MRETSLCLFVRGQEILLAMKKKGFGVGKWNGVGGKFDEKKDKNIEETAIRETEEEIGVKTTKMEKMAILSFYFPQKEEWNQDVHVYFVKEWQGEPKESEEMAPKWFKISDLPFDKMWDDDKIWLPKLLSGNKIKGEFVFDPSGSKIIKHTIFKLD